MIELVSGAVAYKADNWAGDGKKWTGYIFLAFAILLPVLPLMALLNAWGLLLIPYSIFCALAYRKWGVWGELFVDDDDNPMDSKHDWFYSIIDREFGIYYKFTKGEVRKQWKVIGWGVRYCIYAMPIAMLYSWCNLVTGNTIDVLTPFLMLPIAGLVRGVVYWYGQTHKNLAWCERWGGALAMLVIAGSV